MTVRTVVITGANRGLGLGFTRHHLGSGDRVIALVRNPDGARDLQAMDPSPAGPLTVLPCDLGDPDSIRSTAAAVRALTDTVDLLINNAGHYSTRGATVAELDDDEVLSSVRINTLGPMHLTQALRPALVAAGTAKVAQVTSRMGSIADNGKGGSWAYRISKAGLNMANKNLALELQPEGIPCIVLHPGWVATDMGGQGAPLRVAESVAGMCRVIGEATLEDTGRFFNHDGTEIPW